MTKPGEDAVEIVTLDPALAVVVRGTWPMSQLRDAQQQAGSALETSLGPRPPGRRLTVWRMPECGLMDYAPGFLVPEHLDVPDPLSIVELPTGSAAHLAMIGAFDGLPVAWGRLFAGCQARQLTLSGLNWEVYPPADQSAETARTDLYAAIA